MMAYYNSPRGVRFHDRATGKNMLLVEDPEHPFNGWLCVWHPDAKWVSQRKATEDDLARIGIAQSEAARGLTMTRYVCGGPGEPLSVEAEAEIAAFAHHVAYHWRQKADLERAPCRPSPVPRRRGQMSRQSCWFCGLTRVCSLIWHTAKDGNGGYVGMSVPACRNCRGGRDD